jgi:hypothetical protein
MVLLGGAVAGLIGSAYIYQAPLFGAALAIGCVSFLTEAEWAFLGRLLQRVTAVGRIGEEAATQQERRPHVNPAGKQTQNSLLSALEQ